MARSIRSLTISLLCCGALLLAACGDDDDSASDPGAIDSGADITDDPLDDDPFADGDPAKDDDFGAVDEPPPAEDSGTITVGGETTELGNDDFDLCETVNPAFATQFNIVADLADGRGFQLTGDLDDMDPEFDGLFIGEIPDEQHSSEIDVSRDGRTISGTAVVDGEDVEFSFTC